MTDAPYVTSDLQKRQSAAEVATMVGEWKRAAAANAPDRMRGNRNMLAYTSINNGQWVDDLTEELRALGRDPKTFNFIQFLVRGHNGNYQMNTVDPKYVDNDADDIDTMEALEGVQAAYFSMKDRGRYHMSRMQCIENGLVYRGIEELHIVRPGPDPRQWYIGYASIASENIEFDPNNTNDKLSRTSRKCWKRSFLSASDVIRIYAHKEGKILDALSKMKGEEQKLGENYESHDFRTFGNSDISKLGSRLQIIEHYHVEYERSIHQLHKDTGYVLPVTRHSLNSIEDIAIKKAWAYQMGIELTDESVFTYTDWKPCLYLTAFCPSLALILDDRKDERQLNGHLPFYAWSFIQKGGKSIGLVDFLIDAQEDLNKRNMAKTKFMTQTPMMGKTIISEDITDAPINGRMEDIVGSLNDSSKPLVGPSGVPMDQLLRLVPGPQFPSGLLQDESIKVDFMNRIASLPPAMQGMTERSGESGVHMGRKVIEGSIMQKVPQEWVMEHEHDKNEDWFMVFQSIFAGIPNITFSTRDKEHRATINRFEGYGEDGKAVIKANIADLKRVDVIISQAKESDFLRQAKREMDVGALQAIPPSPTNDVIRSAFEIGLAMNMDFADDAERTRVEEACKIRHELAIKSAQVQMAMLDQQLNPPAAPPGGGAGGEGEHAPATQPPGTGDDRAPVPEVPEMARWDSRLR